MSTTRAITLACLALSLTAYTTTSSFAGKVTGGFSARMHGPATFGVVDGHGAAPSVFTLSLGARGTDGSVLFTRTSGGRLTPGTYAITGRDDGSDDVRALIMTGSAERPSGVFRGHHGTVTVSSVSDNVIRGAYRFEASGFVATDPDDERREIRAAGTFTAIRD